MELSVNRFFYGGAGVSANNWLKHALLCPVIYRMGQEPFWMPKMRLHTCVWDELFNNPGATRSQRREQADPVGTYPATETVGRRTN